MDEETKSMLEWLYPENGSGPFYVYILSRPDLRPFYVGKGTGPRIVRHEEEARRACECRKCRTIRKIWREGGEVVRQIVFTTDNEITAFQVEARLIQKFRSQLVNILDCDPRIIGYVEPKPPRLTKRERKIELCRRVDFTMRKLDRRMRRAYLTRDYAAQQRIEAEMEAYEMLIRPPVQLELEGF
jgi:hypothetical protein